MDTNTIVSHLKEEITRMQQVVSLLETVPSTNGHVATKAVKKRRHISPAGRRAISRAMKARWAAKKRS